MKKALGFLIAAFVAISASAQKWDGPIPWGKIPWEKVTSKPQAGEYKIVVTKSGDVTLVPLGIVYETLVKNQTNNVCVQAVRFTNAANAFYGNGSHLTGVSGIVMTNVNQDLTFEGDAEYDIGTSTGRVATVYTSNMVVQTIFATNLSVQIIDATRTVRMRDVTIYQRISSCPLANITTVNVAVINFSTNAPWLSPTNGTISYGTNTLIDWSAGTGRFVRIRSDAHFDKDMLVGDDLTVNDSLFVRGTLDVLGDTTVSNLTITGALDVGTNEISGGYVVMTGFTNSGDGYIAGDLYITGDIHVSADSISIGTVTLSESGGNLQANGTNMATQAWANDQNWQSAVESSNIASSVGTKEGWVDAVGASNAAKVIAARAGSFNIDTYTASIKDGSAKTYVTTFSRPNTNVTYSSLRTVTNLTLLTVPTNSPVKTNLSATIFFAKEDKRLPTKTPVLKETPCPCKEKKTVVQRIVEEEKAELESLIAASSKRTSGKSAEIRPSLYPVQSSARGVVPLGAAWDPANWPHLANKNDFETTTSYTGNGGQYDSWSSYADASEMAAAADIYDNLVNFASDGTTMASLVTNIDWTLVAIDQLQRKMTNCLTKLETVIVNNNTTSENNTRMQSFMDSMCLDYVNELPNNNESERGVTRHRMVVDGPANYLWIKDPSYVCLDGQLYSRNGTTANWLLDGAGPTWWSKIALNMFTNKITSLADPTDSRDAVNLKYLTNNWPTLQIVCQRGNTYTNTSGRKVTLLGGTADLETGTGLFKDSLTVNTNLTVYKVATVHSNLTVHGTIHALKDLLVYRNASVDSNLTVDGSIFCHSNLTVDGTLYAKMDLTAHRDVLVHRHVNVASNVTVQKLLFVYSNATVNGSLDVDLGLDVGKGLTVARDTFVGEDLTVGTNLFVNGYLDVDGVGTFHSNVVVQGTLGVSKTATFSSNVVVQGTLGVSKTATFSSNVTVQGNASVQGTLGVMKTATFSSNVVAQGTLGVTKLTTMTGGFTSGTNGSMGSHFLRDVKDPVLGQDAVTLHYLTNYPAPTLQKVCTQGNVYTTTTERVTLCDGVQSVNAVRKSGITRATLASDVYAGTFLGMGGTNNAYLGSTTAAGYFVQAARQVTLSDSTRAGYFTQGTSSVTLASSDYAVAASRSPYYANLAASVGYAGRFSDGTNTATLGQAANAGVFTSGGRSATLATPTYAGYFSQGTNTATLANASAAGTFVHSPKSATLATATYGGYFTDGTNTATLSSGYAGYFSDGTRNGWLSDRTYAARFEHGTDKAYINNGTYVAKFEDSGRTVDICDQDIYGIHAVDTSSGQAVSILDNDAQALHAIDGTYSADLCNESQAGFFQKDGAGINCIVASGTSAIDATDGTRMADLCNGSQAGWFQDGATTPATVELADGTQAGEFVKGSVNVILGAATIAVDATDGTRSADLCNATEAVYGYDGTRTAKLADGTQAVYAYDGAKTATLADGTQAGHFTDGTRTVNVANGSLSLTASGGGATVELDDGTYAVEASGKPSYFSNTRAVTLAGGTYDVEAAATGISAIHYYAGAVQGIDYGSGAFDEGLLIDGAKLTNLIGSAASSAAAAAISSSAAGAWGFGPGGTCITSSVPVCVSPDTLYFGDAAIGWRTLDRATIEARIPTNGYLWVKALGALGGNLKVSGRSEFIGDVEPEANIAFVGGSTHSISAPYNLEVTAPFVSLVGTGGCGFVDESIQALANGSGSFIVRKKASATNDIILAYMQGSIGRAVIGDDAESGLGAYLSVNAVAPNRFDFKRGKISNTNATYVIETLTDIGGTSTGLKLVKNGTRKVGLGYGTTADVYVENGTDQIQLGAVGVGSIYATDGARSVTLCKTSGEAGHFTDGTRTVALADSTYAVYAKGTSLLTNGNVYAKFMDVSGPTHKAARFHSSDANKFDVYLAANYGGLFTSRGGTNAVYIDNDDYLLSAVDGTWSIKMADVSDDIGLSVTRGTKVASLMPATGDVASFTDGSKQVYLCDGTWAIEASVGSTSKLHNVIANTIKRVSDNATVIDVANRQLKVGDWIVDEDLTVNGGSVPAVLTLDNTEGAATLRGSTTNGIGMFFGTIVSDGSYIRGFSRGSTTPNQIMFGSLGTNQLIMKMGKLWDFEGSTLEDVALIKPLQIWDTTLMKMTSAGSGGVLTNVYEIRGKDIGTIYVKNSVSLTGNLNPVASNVYSLGSVSLPWSDLYAKNVHASTMSSPTLDVISSLGEVTLMDAFPVCLAHFNTIDLTQGIVIGDGTTGISVDATGSGDRAAYFKAEYAPWGQKQEVTIGDLTTGKAVYVTNTSTVITLGDGMSAGLFTSGGGNSVELSRSGGGVYGIALRATYGNQIVELGSPKGAGFFKAAGLEVNLCSNTTAMLVKGNILPATTATYNLGSPTLRWATAYLGTDSVYLGTNKVSASNGALRIACGSSTSSLASVSFVSNTVANATNGFVTASITNGLASTGFVTGQGYITTNLGGASLTNVGTIYAQSVNVGTNSLKIGGVRLTRNGSNKLTWNGSPMSTESYASGLVSSGTNTTAKVFTFGQATTQMWWDTGMLMLAFPNQILAPNIAGDHLYETGGASERIDLGTRTLKNDGGPGANWTVEGQGLAVSGIYDGGGATKRIDVDTKTLADGTWSVTKLDTDYIGDSAGPETNILVGARVLHGSWEVDTAPTAGKDIATWTLVTNKVAMGDVDKLDGQHGAYYRNWTSITNDSEVVTTNASFTMKSGTTATFAKIAASSDIEQGTDDWHYWGSPTANGSWRFGPTGAVFNVQTRIGGVWSNATVFTKP